MTTPYQNPNPDGSEPDPNIAGQPGHGQPNYSQPVYGQPATPAYGQPTTPVPGQPTYTEPTYTEPGYPDQPRPGSPYGEPGTYASTPYSAAPTPYPVAPYGTQFAPPLPDHPQAQLSLILGILGVIGVTVLSPFAWAIASKARKEVAANPGVYSATGNLTAGWVLGIIGTVLLGLALVGILFFVLVIFVASANA